MNFTNIKRLGPELPLADTNSDDRKTLHIHFVAKLLNDMKDNTTAIFTYGGSFTNPGPAGAGAVIFRAGSMNELPIKLAKTAFSKSTNNHGEKHSSIYSQLSLKLVQTQFTYLVIVLLYLIPLHLDLHKKYIMTN